MSPKINLPKRIVGDSQREGYMMFYEALVDFATISFTDNFTSMAYHKFEKSTCFRLITFFMDGLKDAI